MINSLRYVLLGLIVIMGTIIWRLTLHQEELAVEKNESIKALVIDKVRQLGKMELVRYNLSDEEVIEVEGVSRK